MRRATERVTLLCQAASHVEKNIGGVELVKALARCLDAKMADQDPFGGLGLRLHQIDDPGEEAPHPRRNGNVIAGPWDAGEEARP